MGGVNLKDFPQAKEGVLIFIVSFYREFHNREKGKPCECGVCQMAQKLLVEQLGIDLTVDPQHMTWPGISPETTLEQKKARLDESFAMFKKIGE